MLNEQGCGGTFMGNMIMGPDQQRQFFLSFFVCALWLSPFFLENVNNNSSPHYPFFPFWVFSFSRFFSFLSFSLASFTMMQGDGGGFFSLLPPVFFLRFPKKKVLEKRKETAGFLRRGATEICTREKGGRSEV